MRISNVVFAWTWPGLVLWAVPAAGQVMTVGYPGVSYGYSYHASTLQEGIGRGLADVITSQGIYNELTSRAAINNAEAYSRELDNAKKGIDTYFETRAINRKYRADERGARPTQEDLARYARIGKPKRLNDGDLNPLTGRVSWPLLLRGNQFAEQRAAIEQILARRAVDGSLGPEDYLKLSRIAAAMENRLKGEIREFPADEYLFSKRFLERVAYEARFTASAGGLAVSRDTTSFRALPSPLGP
jgi:hypothetical protein